MTSFRRPLRAISTALAALVAIPALAQMPMPTPRFNHGVGVVNDILYAVGGRQGSPSFPYLSVLEAYAPVPDSWTTRMPLPSPRAEMGVEGVNGRLYVFGGSNATTVLNEVLEYNPGTNSWTSKMPMPVPASRIACAEVGGIVYILAGVNLSGFISNVMAYNVAANSWTVLGPIPTMREAPSAAFVNGVIHVVGGAGDSTVNEAYDPATDTWDLVEPPMLTGRNFLSTASACDRMVAIGGQNSSGLPLAAAERFMSGSWTALTPLTTARRALPEAAGLIGNTVYVVGGLGVGVGPAAVYASVETYTLPAGNVSSDACSGAIAIGPGLTYGSTIGSTPSGVGTLIPGPCGASANTGDVWYTYTPPCNGQLTLDTCDLPCSGGRYDTVLSVYTGTCGLLTEVPPGACNDDDPSYCNTGYPWGSQVTTDVTCGVDYKIRVSGYDGPGWPPGNLGNFALNLAFVQQPLTNDDICSAIQVPCGTSAFGTCGASHSTTASGCTFFEDVWYSFTTTCAGNATVDTCGSQILDTVLEVYSGSCATPASVACNNNAPAGSACPSLWSSVTFLATANTTYYVRVGAAFAGVQGCGVLNISCPTAVATCPPAPPGCQGTSVPFYVTGFSNNTAWAFRLTIPCCFDLYVPNVPGVPTSGNQNTDEANLRDRFVMAINNAGCVQVPPLATAHPFGVNGVSVYGLFTIKACDCGSGAIPVELSVGSAGSPANSLCTVPTNGSLPTTGPCSFNPEIVQVDLPGTDCNGNGQDDYMDIVTGTSIDADQDYVPDECDGGSLEPFCFPGQGGVIACPCGNPPTAPGRGCNNFGAGPADSGRLVATGVASLSSDSVVLHATGENNASLTVFWTGTGTNWPPGVVHGAGVRCVTGLKRLYTGSASGGAISRPAGADPSVSVRTAAVGAPISAGQTRNYFNVYRDPQAAGPCGNSSSTINLTNAGAIKWQP